MRTGVEGGRLEIDNEAGEFDVVKQACVVIEDCVSKPVENCAGSPVRTCPSDRRCTRSGVPHDAGVPRVPVGASLGLVTDVRGTTWELVNVEIGVVIDVQGTTWELVKVEIGVVIDVHGTKWELVNVEIGVVIDVHGTTGELVEVEFARLWILAFASFCISGDAWKSRSFSGHVSRFNFWSSWILGNSLTSTMR